MSAFILYRVWQIKVMLTYIPNAFKHFTRNKAFSHPCFPHLLFLYSLALPLVFPADPSFLHLS